MEIKTYDLPDIELLEDASSIYRCMVWEPEFFCIVLGQSNRIEDAVIVENVEKDGIFVYKRPSGGETVVLSPNTLVISILQRGQGLRSPRLYFNSYSEKIIEALRGLGIGDLSFKGISDICLGDRKILGSSIYRNKDMVFYHAVLNRAESVEMMERYLEHPPREPEYREGRSHRDFVTSLARGGYDFSGEELRQAFLEELNHK
jgi:lipoate-protein ligase A